MRLIVTSVVLLLLAELWLIILLHLLLTPVSTLLADPTFWIVLACIPGHLVVVRRLLRWARHHSALREQDHCLSEVKTPTTMRRWS